MFTRVCDHHRSLTPERFLYPNYSSNQPAKVVTTQTAPGTSCGLCLLHSRPQCGLPLGLLTE